MIRNRLAELARTSKQLAGPPRRADNQPRTSINIPVELPDLLTHFRIAAREGTSLPPCLERRVTAPAACAGCNHHDRWDSTAIDAPAAAIQTPGIRPPLDDSFSTAQTDRRTTQLLAPSKTPSPSQLKQPSRHGCGAIPSRWASRVVPGASGGAEGARGSRRSSFTKKC